MSALADLPALRGPGVLKGPSLVPGSLAACPCYCRRPRDQVQFQAASDAALGQQVREFDAADLSTLEPGVEVWFDEGFWPLVSAAGPSDGREDALVVLRGPCSDVEWCPAADEPVYVKIDLPLPMA